MAASAREAVERAYARGENDEFIAPTVIARRGEQPARLRNGDAAIFFNFRADRARQLTRALTEPTFSEFRRPDRLSLHFVCFTRYKKEFPQAVAFPPLELAEVLAQVWAEHSVPNLRVAETEKYAHVTYFFNGGVERAFPGEQRVLIPSWKGATYDLHPQMSAAGVTDEVVSALEKASFGALVVNFANADMVGHTGKLPETVTAIETLDGCFARIETAARQAGALLLMTADHGNAEQMLDAATGQPHTAHTTNPVPFVICRKEERPVLRRDGALGDVAPTLLRLQGLPVPEAMTGRDLRDL